MKLICILSCMIGVYPLIYGFLGICWSGEPLAWIIFLIGAVMVFFSIRLMGLVDENGNLTVDAVMQYFSRVWKSIRNPNYKKEEKRAKELRQFYSECQNNGCHSLKKEKEIARAKLIADNLSISYPKGIEELYKEAKALCIQEQKVAAQEKEKQRLAELREKEESQFYKFIQYSRLTGREKKITMLTNARVELLNYIEKQDKMQKYLMTTIYQKESNPAVWGGIANGLAGPVAGIYTALDVRDSNSRIREQNHANMRAAMPAFMVLDSRTSQCRENIREIEREIERTKTKLVAETPAQEVLSLLNITNPTVDVSETGAYYITATVEPKKNLYIFGDTPATADGTIIAHLWQNQKEIGTAKLVLPVNGVSGTTGIAGMGLSGADQKAHYTVTFSAENLWLMEK